MSVPVHTAVWNPRGVSGDGGSGSHPVCAAAAGAAIRTARKIGGVVRKSARGAMVS
jgi:hypothetical protein